MTAHTTTPHTTHIPAQDPDTRFKDVRVWDFQNDQWLTFGRPSRNSHYPDTEIWETLRDDGAPVAPYWMTASDIEDLIERSSEFAGHPVQ